MHSRAKDDKRHRTGRSLKNGLDSSQLGSVARDQPVKRPDAAYRGRQRIEMGPGGEEDAFDRECRVQSLVLSTHRRPVEAEPHRVSTV